MGDQVLADGLPADMVMYVHERIVVLPDGTTVWLRRFRLNDERRRIELDGGRWLAQHSIGPHLYAYPLDATHGGGARWRYRAPYTFPTWQDALAAAVAAQATWVAEHRTLTAPIDTPRPSLAEQLEGRILRPENTGPPKEQP